MPSKSQADPKIPSPRDVDAIGIFLVEAPSRSLGVHGLARRERLRGKAEDLAVADDRPRPLQSRLIATCGPAGCALVPCDPISHHHAPGRSSARSAPVVGMQANDGYGARCPFVRLLHLSPAKSPGEVEG